jgi:rhamnopyranosyl-N-acetylglucosaminyl-diphospho-decaprenol beta-1,3/1,4-galactofuranosyltransferase
VNLFGLDVGVHVPKVNGVFVTQDPLWPETELLTKINLMGLENIIIVINGDYPERIEIKDNVHKIFVGYNSGGAGGFSKGFQYSLALKSDFTWTSDDDSKFEDAKILKELLSVSIRNNLDICSPINTDSTDKNKVAFPYRRFLVRIWNKERLKRKKLIKGQIHLFNGALFKNSLIAEIGTPNDRLFIRGDEREYLLRAKANGALFATTTNVEIIHPPGSQEFFYPYRNLPGIPIPHSQEKFAYYLRNRGYVTRKYRRLDWLIVDILRYTTLFFRMGTKDEVIQSCIRTYWLGVSQNLETTPEIPNRAWLRIDNARSN